MTPFVRGDRHLDGVGLLDRIVRLELARLREIADPEWYRRGGAEGRPEPDGLAPERYVA